MNMEKEMKYEAPEVEILEVEVEGGYNFSFPEGDWHLSIF